MMPCIGYLLVGAGFAVPADCMQFVMLLSLGDTESRCPPAIKGNMVIIRR